MRKYGFSTVVSLFVLSIVSLNPIHAMEPLKWEKKELLAGKADLGNDGYTLNRTLGVANFSPEFRMPVQFTYNSLEKHKGLLGDFWTCPQLESRVFPRDKGAEWRTPWGEKISFFEKEKITKDTLDLYKEKMKGGQGLFSPFSDWEAKGEKGDWRIEGQDKKSGWVFEYKDSYLQKISAPTGRTLLFHYRNKQLVKVEENEFAFIELSYNDKQLDSITINGIKSSLNFSNVKGVVLPEKQGQKPSDKLYALLSRVQYASLAPEEFSYDDYGYLSGTKRGSASEKITVVHETPGERNAWLDKLAEAEKLKRAKLLVQEKVTGRILSDKDFTYAYPAKETVTLTNAEKQTATYNYSGLKGVLKIKDFAGLNSEICYFRRYDVAYNGKLRQIRDAQDRVVLNCRYDKKTGEIIRSRDMMDNETYYSYDKNRNLILVSRSEENVDKRPLVSIKYDQKNNPVEYELLDKDGKPVTATKLKYGQNLELTSIETPEAYNKFNYNAFGYLTKFTDTFGRVFARNYDKFNRLVSQVSPEGVFVVYSYDANGQIANIEKYASEKKAELLSSVRFDYNPQGQVISLTDDKGRTKKFDRDMEGKVIAEYFPDNSMVKYSFDKLGRLNEVIDQNGNPIEFSWNAFGKLNSKQTAAGQLQSNDYDKYGLLTSTENAFKDTPLETDKTLSFSYDEFDRLTRINYGNGRSKIFSYDSWNKVLSIVANDMENGKGIVRKTDFTYDQFSRLARKTICKFVDSKKNSLGVAAETLVYEYTYTPTGKRDSATITFPDGSKKMTKNTYDKYGRLSEIDDSGKKVTYKYDNKSKLIEQTIDGVPIKYSYTKYGQLSSKIMGDDEKNPIASLKYTYAKDGMLLGKEVNGKLEKYEYDLKGQLLAVDGETPEKYEYDKAGNILKKQIGDKITAFTYDRANQLLLSVTDGKIVKYSYDAAGRMTNETSDTVSKNYTYGWLDKVMEVKDSSGALTSFSYNPDEQIAERKSGNDIENFYWDGLALIKRGDTNYTNEPAMTGGNPIISSEKVMFNDVMGTTVGIVENGKFSETMTTAFGDKGSQLFFTGKPYIPELGYAFWLRSYRPDLGRWQVADPLGYPDGWNNFAYVNNHVTSSFDFSGGEEYYGYYYYNDGYYYYSETNYFVGGQAQSEINNLTDALAHYRSGVGGTVSAGSGLYAEMTNNSTYQNRIVGNNSVLANKIVAQALSKVSLSEKSGTISNTPGAEIGQMECSTLGSYCFSVLYSTTWTSTAWQKDASGQYYRDVSTGPFTVFLSGQNGWDFTWNATYNLWQNITRELIPGWIAGAIGNPASFSITYSISVNYSLTTRQYE